MTSARATILFVDDETPVLNGLRRNLMAQQSRWRLLFAPGGAPALALMAAEPVDVVVSDMRMPGMDGASLLEEVRRRSPATARFILSGFSEREAMFQTLGPAHQYFAKPCDTATLVRAIERTLSFRPRLNAPELLALVSGPATLPSLPKALAELFDALQAPDGSAAEVARIISSDIGLGAQVLKLVNSVYFFPAAKVTDILQSVKLLGFELIRSVAALAGIFDAFRTAGIDREAIARLERRSLEIGLLARRLAESEHFEPADATRCQCAGMLAHVGSLILFAHRGREMTGMAHELDEAGGELIAAEVRHFGASHAELGASLLSLWGFNDAVVEAVFHHHQPGRAVAEEAARLGTVGIVHAAQHLVEPAPADPGRRDAWLANLDRAYLERVGAAGRLAAWLEQATALRREFGA